MMIFLKCHHFLNYTELANQDGQSQTQRKLIVSLEQPSYKNLLNDIFTFANIIDARAVSEDADKNVLHQIHEYSLSLRKAVEQWYLIYNPDQSNDVNNYHFWLSKLNKISSNYTYPIILSIMLKTNDNYKRKEAFRVLERAIFVTKITSGIYSQDFTHLLLVALSNSIKLYKDEIEVDKFTEELDAHTDKILGTDFAKKQIRDSLRSRNYYTWTGVRYFLYEYNLSIQLQSKTHREKID